MNTTKTKTPSFLIGDDFISITVNGKAYTIYKNDARFMRVIRLIKKKNFKDIDKALDTARVIELYSFNNIKVMDGVILFKNTPLNNILTQKILTFVEKDYPFQALVKFLDKLMSNPSENSRNQLYSFIEKYKMPICDDGDFLAYKAVTNTLKDKHTGQISNKVGNLVKMNREEVVDDPNSGCHCGLHIGDLEGYVRGFASDDDVIILVKINPRDVVSVPNDSSYAKMRVCQYKVIKRIGAKTKVKAFESDYCGKVKAEHLDGNETVKSSPVAKSTTLISATKAYELYRKGGMVYDNGIALSQDANCSRSYFRSRKNSVWTVVNKSTKYIGSNKAYELHKAGKVVEKGGGMSNYIIKPSDHKSRSFFREHNNWRVEV